MPQRIFLAQEEATPIQGFPILLTDSLAELRESLASYVEAEEEFELSSIRGRSIGRNRANAAWESYAQPLERATENSSSSSFGRQFPSIFWLYHSVAVARLFKESPRRVRRTDLAVGKTHGDRLKYLIFNRYLDKVLSVSYDVARRVAESTEDQEKEHFPTLLTRMRDNVLILTEDHISPDLGELGSFFAGCLRMDGREFRERFARLVEWHDHQLERPEFRDAIGRMLGVQEHQGTGHYLARPGYVSFLATRRDYDQDQLLPTPWIKVWETLVNRIKEFELLARAAPVGRADPGIRRPAQVLGGLGGHERQSAQRSRAVGEHPADGLHDAVGGRSAGRALRPDLRHHRVLGDRLGAQALRQSNSGRLDPPDLQVPASGEPHDHGAPPAAREVSRRRRALLRAFRDPAAGCGGSPPALLQVRARRGLPLRSRDCASL